MTAVTYYKKLKLDHDPFINRQRFFRSMKFKSVMATGLGFGVFNEPDHLLKPSILNAFSKIGVRLKSLIVFGNSYNSNSTTFDKRYLHKDLTWNPQLKLWQAVRCGINWEFGDSNLFRWYRTDMFQEFSPPAPPDFSELGNKDEDSFLKRNYLALNGIHFVERQKEGIHDGAVILDETYIDAPTLVRTDVAHATEYKSNIKRYAVSLRIDETDLTDWGQILDMFKPLYLAEK